VSPASFVVAVGTRSRDRAWLFPKELPYPPNFAPSPWVRSHIDGRFAAADGCVYRCIGYDPRLGFWVQNEADPEDFTVFSESALRALPRLDAATP